MKLKENWKNIKLPTLPNNSNLRKRLEEAYRKSQERVITRNPLWKAAEFFNQVNKDVMELREKWKTIKISPPPDNSKAEYLRNRLEKAGNKFVELERTVSEKYQLFEQYRDKVLREIQHSEDSLEMADNESLTEPGEADHEEIIGFPTIIEEIEEKARMCDNCWKITKLEHNMGHFTTLYEKLNFSVEYNANNLVNNITTKSLLTDYSEPIAFFLQKEMLRALSRETICNSIGRNYNILSLLDYIQMVMEKIKKYHTEIKVLEKDHQFSLTRNFMATLIIIDIELLVKWVFTMDLSDLENITRSSISVQAPVGTVSEKYLQDLVLECPKGIHFIQNYFSKIQNYLKLLKKRKLFLKQKVIS